MQMPCPSPRNAGAATVVGFLVIAVIGLLAAIMGPWLIVLILGAVFSFMVGMLVLMMCDAFDIDLPEPLERLFD